MDGHGYLLSCLLLVRRGVGEDGAEFGGLLVNGLRAVAGEQAYGRLPGQFRGGDVGGGRESEAGFLDGHVDEVGQSGPLARDAGVEEPQREPLADRGEWGRWRRGTGCR